MFWLIVFVIVIFLGCLGSETSSANYKIYRVLLIIVLSFVTMLISENGTDFLIYQRSFGESYSIKDLHFSFNLGIDKSENEIGYMLICAVAKLLHLGYPGLLIIIYSFINTSIVSTIYKFRFPLLGVAAYFVSITFAQQINLQRQMIAIAGILIGLSCLKEKKIAQFYICNVVAFLFHSSAIFLLPLGLLGIIDNSKYYRPAIITATAFWFFSILINIGAVNVSGLLRPMTMLLGDTYYSDYLTLEDGVGMGTDVSLIFQSLMLFAIMSKDQDNLIYTLYFIIGCSLANIATAMPNMARFAFYFTSFCPLYVSQLLKQNELSKLRFISYLFYIYYFAYRIPLTIISRGTLEPDFYLLSNIFNL